MAMFDLSGNQPTATGSTGRFGSLRDEEAYRKKLERQSRRRQDPQKKKKQEEPRDLRSNIAKLKDLAVGNVKENVSSALDFGGAVESVIQDVTGGTAKRTKRSEDLQQTLIQRKREIRESGVLSPEAKKKLLGDIRQIEERNQQTASKRNKRELGELQRTTQEPVVRGGAAFGAGVGRSLVGLGQGASGLVDLATPGEGRSRVTQGLNRTAEGADTFVKENELSNVAYKGGQLTGEALQLLTGAQMAQIALQSPMVATRVAQVAQRTGKLEEMVSALAKTGKVGKTTAEVSKYLLNPARVANIAGNVAIDQGQLAARGEDISPKSVGISTAANYALGGVLEGTSAALSRFADRGVRARNVDSLTSFEGAPDRKRVEFYKNKIQSGEDVDPLLLKRDSKGNLGVEDGKHRLQAYKELGITEVPTTFSTKSIEKLNKTAGRVDQELNTALAKVEDNSISTDLRQSFGSKNKQRVEAVARRNGIQTSRVKQFYDAAEKELVAELEAAPLGTRSGQVQTNVDTFAAAAQRGPINLTDVKVGQKVDAVDVARARMTVGTYIEEAQKAIRSGDTKAIKSTKESLDKALEGYRIITSEPGRATQIQSQFDNKAVQAFEAISDYQKTIADGQTPTKGQIDYMNQILQDMTEDVKVSRTQQAKDFVYAGDTSVIRKLEEYATSAKLTSPTTHVRNIVGNTLTFTQRALEQSVATGIGAARGRTSLRALGSTFGTRSGYKEATQKFFGILNDAARLRSTSENLAAGEGYKDAIGGKFGEFVRIPFKFLEAADEFGKTILRDSKLHQEAYDLAYREGARGTALQDRVAQLIQTPTQKMLKAADNDALEYTFQKDLGKVGSGFQKIIKNIPGGKFFVPFIKTPTNIAKFQLQRSVVGAPGQLVKGVVKRGTREGDEALARAVTGTLLSLGTYNWVRDNADKITGAAPTKQSEKDAFYAAGKQPYAIKVGNRWVSYQSFQPVGMYLLQAKSLADAIDKNDEKGAVAIASSMAQVAAKGMLELPFVQGMNNVVEVLAAGEDYAGSFSNKAEKFITDTAKGFVPNGLRDIRLYTDEIVRAPKGIKEGLYDMIPGLSKQVAPRYNVLGEKATRKDSPLARSLFRVFGSQEQPTQEEFKILQGVAKNADYTVSSPVRTQRGKKLNDKDYAAYQKAYYERFRRGLNDVMEEDWFQRRSWEGKKEEIQRIVREAGNDTRDEFFGEK